MAMQIIVDPKELMDTAVLVGSSAVELAEIGSTLRACTGCEMPPDVRGQVDAFVSTLDRVLDEMAAGLRSEAGGLAQRAVIAANDMLTAAGLPPLPGTIATTPGGDAALIGGHDSGTITMTGRGSSTMTIGGHDSGTITMTNPDGTPYVSPSSMTIGGNNWGTITITNPDGTPYVSPSSVTIGGGVTSNPLGQSQANLAAALNHASAGGAARPAGSFAMPGALSLMSLPIPYNPWVGMSMSDIRTKVGGLPTTSEIKYYNPALASARARGIG